MEPMTWKVLGLAAIISFCFAQTPASTVRGKLLQAEGKPPAIETGAAQRISLDGEPESMTVLRDHRLVGADLELHGEFKTPAAFVVGSFYTSKSMLVHRDGKKYTISYWCPVCSIRTYTPGKCMCCQEETHLDLEEVK
jgi:hypothetical protein